MAMQEMGRAEVNRSGIYGDRVYRLVDPSRKEGKASWVTARKLSDLVLYRPHVERVPYGIDVETPCGHRWHAESPELAAHLSERYGRQVVVESTPGGTMDQSPVSIIGMQTITTLSAEMGRELGRAIDLDHRRFRANFGIEWRIVGGAFFEDSLVGRSIAIGEGGKGAAFTIVELDPRCVMINIDPDNAERIDLYKLVQREHGRHVGVYAEVLREGVVARGDPVYLI